MPEHEVDDLDIKAMEFGDDVVLFDVTAPESWAAVGLVKSVCPDTATVAVAVTCCRPRRVMTMASWSV